MNDTNGPLALAVMQGAEGIRKAQAVVQTFPGIWHGRVIDVGARTREIEAALAGTDPPGDRHRWFALDDARRFVYTNAERHGWSVQDERAFIGARRAKAT